MPPAPRRDEIDDALSLVAGAARRYLEGLDERPLRGPGTEAAADSFGGALPEDGVGALPVLRELLDRGLDAHVASGGPRFFHYVIGGVTPAAMAAAWLTDALDQNPGL